MRCIKCDYPLWNLDTPRCPECGEPFTLQHFRFEPHSVAFACMHCGHEHVGVGPHYLPKLRGSRCEGCGRVIEPWAMRVVAMGGEHGQVDAAHTRPVPWEDRTIKRGPAWWQTLRTSLRRPRELGQRLGGVRTAGWATIYAVMLHIGAFGLAGAALLIVFITDEFLVHARPVDDFFMTGVVFVMGVALFGGVWWPVTLTAIWSLLVDTPLRLAGQARGGFETTMTTLYYAQGPVAIAGLAVLGSAVIISALAIGQPTGSPQAARLLMLTGFVIALAVQPWILFNAVVMLAQSQRLTLTTAACAVLWAPAAITGMVIVAALAI